MIQSSYASSTIPDIDASNMTSSFNQNDRVRRFETYPFLFERQVGNLATSALRNAVAPKFAEIIESSVSNSSRRRRSIETEQRNTSHLNPTCYTYVGPYFSSDFYNGAYFVTPRFICVFQVPKLYIYFSRNLPLIREFSCFQAWDVSEIWAFDIFRWNRSNVSPATFTIRYAKIDCIVTNNISNIVDGGFHCIWGRKDPTFWTAESWSYPGQSLIINSTPWRMTKEN